MFFLSFSLPKVGTKVNDTGVVKFCSYFNLSAFDIEIKKSRKLHKKLQFSKFDSRFCVVGKMYNIERVVKCKHLTTLSILCISMMIYAF